MGITNVKQTIVYKLIERQGLNELPLYLEIRKEGIVMDNNLNENTGTLEQQEVTEEKTKTYTQEEVDELLQKEGDRRISQYQKTLEKRQREANKLSRMSESERAEYELSERERQLEERENKLILAENKTACTNILLQKGLDVSLVDFVVAADADTMNDNIKRLEKAFKASVKSEVEKRLQGTSPKKNLAEPETMTKKDLMNMNVRELQAFKNQNPEIFQQIMGS